MYGYIYKTTNLVNGKIYVGKKKGEFTHSYKGSGKYLKNAISKYGDENFTVDIIEYCDTLEYQNEREKYWIKYYRDLGTPMYNIANGGEGGDVFSKLSNEDKEITLKRMSDANKRNHIVYKENYKKGAQKAWDTRRKNGTDKMTPEQRKRLSELHKGYKVSDEVRRKLSERFSGENHPLYGKHRSEETRKKLSESHKGYKHTEETKRKMSESQKGEHNGFYGKHHTDKTKQKISECNKLGICGMRGKHLTDEQRKHHSDSMIGKGLNTKWMNDGIKCVKVDINDVQKYLDIGYVLGRKTRDAVFVPWNKGKTAEEDERVAKNIRARVETVNKRKQFNDINNELNGGE